jgi:biopolymer transport protein ExbB
LKKIMIVSAGSNMTKRFRAVIPVFLRVAAALFAGMAPTAALAQSAQASGPIAAAPPMAASGLLQSDLSPWGMFLAADIVVKIVIILLAFASVATWTIWLVKSLELTMEKRRLGQGLRDLHEASSLASAAERLGAQRSVARAMVSAAQEEWRASSDALDDRDGLKERIALHLERTEAAAGRRMMVGTGLLASIGATAPFVGLFGTVWGIMNSFIGISKTQATNLAVVAPGIAEALLATACGLVAAIPAVVIYNHFARQTAGYKAATADAAAAVMRLASRDLSRPASGASGANLRIVAE